MTAKQKMKKFQSFAKKFNQENKTSPRSRKPNQFYHLAYARFEVKSEYSTVLVLKRNMEEDEDGKITSTQFLTFALSYDDGFNFTITTDSFGDLYAKHIPSKTLFSITPADIEAFKAGREVILYAVFIDDSGKEAIDLKDTIIQDVKYLNDMHNSPYAPGLVWYSFQEHDDSEISGLYSLLYNFNVIWYGTLEEINAVVKALIKRMEVDEKEA